MANISKVITLTEKNDSGPLYDLYYSIDSGSTYTASVDGQNLYLPYVGASDVATVDASANVFKLTSKGVCVNFETSGSIILPTPTPTPTGTYEQECTTYVCQDTFGGYVYYTDCTTGSGSAVLMNPVPAEATICSRTYPTFENVSGFVKTVGGNCGYYTPTPTPTPSPSPTPTGPTPTPTPTTTGSIALFGAHDIAHSSLYQHKSVWAGSSNMYLAQQLLIFLTGQSSPATSTSYPLSNTSYDISDGTNVIRASLTSASGTALYFFDGSQAVVQVDNVFISGSYVNSSFSSYDTWRYIKY